MYKKTLCVIALVLVSSVTTWAALNGDIEGVVRDGTGAIIPSAGVTITSVETGVQRTLVTNERGYFIATLLPIGEYDVKVELPGFQASQERVLVKSAERVSLNITLGVTKVETILNVSVVTSQLVNTTDAQLSVSIEEKRVKDLPLVSRDPLVLATLSPGVVPVTAANPFLGTGSFNANGGRGRANNITIDNVVSSDVSTTGQAGFGTLSLDAIQEFKLITNNFNAEFGRNASSQVQIITKGGSNQFHGTAYEFLRNDALNARDYFDTTGKASILRRNQFGATAGGAILRDKMFYFGHYEGLQVRGAAGTRSARVPTAAQRAAITDPTSAALITESGIPAAATNDATGAFGTVSQTAPVSTKSNAWSARIDRNFGGGRDLISGRYSTQSQDQNSEGNTFVGTNLSGYGASSKNKPQNFSLGYTRVLSARVVNEGRFAFGRSKPNFFPQSTKNVPRVIITGFDQFGESDIIPQGRVQNTFQYSDTLTYSTGRHTWKYGVDVHRIQANSAFDSSVRGIVRFASWDDFSAGRVQQWQQNFGSTVRGNRLTNVFAFAQDDYRVGPDLTLNLGFRLEVAGGVSEVNGILSNLDPSTPAAIGGGGTGPLGGFVLGGTAFARNYNWQPRVGFAWSPGDWVVRSGYGISSDFIFLNPITNLRFAPPFVQALSPTSGFTGANSYANLVAGSATIQADARAAVGKFNPTQVNFGNFSPIDRDLNNPQVQQWSLTVERQLTPTFAAKASYVGTAAHHLLRSRHMNMIPQGTVRPATSEADEIARMSEFTSAFAGYSGSVTTGSRRLDPRFNAVTLVESSANSAYHALEAQVIKRYSKGYHVQVAYTWSKSMDDASDVLNVVVNDNPTAQNPFDLKNNRSVSQFDIPHRLVVNHVYEPQFFNNMNGAAGKVLRGWGFSGIFQIQSGFPSNIFAGSRFGINDISLTGTGANLTRASVVGDISKLVFAPLGSPTAATIPTPAARGINTTAAQRNTNTSNYPLVQPLLGNVGTMGRNAIRLNRLSNFDWVILKNTQVSEALNVQFRSEFYNVFNNTSFARFDNNISSPTFGTYAGTDTTPRQIQFALKLIW